MEIPRTIDHIVYSVIDLDSAIDKLEQTLGVRPIIGGYHKTKGTKNALLNLGNKVYLEILAADDENTSIAKPRWMGIDLLSNPKITRWCINSNDLSKDSHILSKYQPSMGMINGGQRNTPNGSLLKWEMILPLAEPEVDLVPFMTDWSTSESHPTDSIENQCELVKIILTHPSPREIQDTINELGLVIKIITGNIPKINIVIKCPNGTVTI